MPAGTGVWVVNSTRGLTASTAAANVVAPANGFSNVAPRRISFRMGGYITAGLGLAMFPWKLLETSQGYIFTWLVGYSALLGPIGGILIADYFIIRRRELVVEHLYRRGGRYEYVGGFNPAALVALVIGVAPNVPGFLAQAFPDRFAGISSFWSGLYSYAWFLGFGLAALVYVILMRGRRG